MRPNFFVNTPDILHAYLQHGGRPAFEARAVLAATLSPVLGRLRGLRAVRERSGARRAARSTWTRRSTSCGRATGRRPRREGRSLAPLITALNRLRRAHPALQQLRNLHFHRTDNDAVIAYSKRTRRRTTPCWWSSTSTRTTPGRPPSRWTCRELGLDLARVRHRCATSSPARPTTGAATTTCASTRASARARRSRCDRPHRSEGHPIDRQRTRPRHLRGHPRQGPRSRLVQARRLLRGPGPLLPGQQRRRHRRPEGPHRQARLPPVARASTASGCRRSSPRRCATAATTSPTTPRCCRSSATSPTSWSSSTPPTSAACG